MAITYISPGVTNIAASSTSLTATYSTAINAGDLLIATIRANDPPTVSDNINGSWGAALESTASFGYIFAFVNSASASANSLTITVTAGSSGATIRIVADQFRGVDTSNTFISGSQVVTSASTTQTCATTSSVPDGYLVFAGFTTGTNSITFTAGSTNGATMTAGATQSTSSTGCGFNEYLLSSVSGTQAPTCTTSVSASVSALCVIFKAATVVGINNMLLLGIG